MVSLHTNPECGGSGIDLIEEKLTIAGAAITLLRPRDSEALLDEHAFEEEEYLPYWAELWPSALALAEALAAAPLAGRRVLELGCGLGVPSLVAARGGARVTATDWSPEAIRVLRGNAALAGVTLDARRWAWTDDPAALGEPRWPLVVGADVLYERRNGPQLLAILPRLLAPGGEAWIADPGRRMAEPFLAAAAATWTLDTVAHAGPATVTVHRVRLRTASASPGRA